MQVEVRLDQSHHHTNQKMCIIMGLASDNSVTIMASRTEQKYYFAKNPIKITDSDEKRITHKAI